MDNSNVSGKAGEDHYATRSCFIYLLPFNDFEKDCGL